VELWGELVLILEVSFDFRADAILAS